jgi:hypothetical protein
MRWNREPFSQLFRIGDESLGVESRIAALAVVMAA